MVYRRKFVHNKMHNTNWISCSCMRTANSILFRVLETISRNVRQGNFKLSKRGWPVVIMCGSEYRWTCAYYFFVVASNNWLFRIAPSELCGKFSISWTHLHHTTRNEFSGCDVDIATHRRPLLPRLSCFMSVDWIADKWQVIQFSMLNIRSGFFRQLRINTRTFAQYSMQHRNIHPLCREISELPTNQRTRNSPLRRWSAFTSTRPTFDTKMGFYEVVKVETRNVSNNNCILIPKIIFIQYYV